MIQLLNKHLQLVQPLKNFLYDGCGETEGFHLSPNVQIGFQAFNGCTAITNVHIVMDVRTSENGLSYDAPYIGTRAFADCTGIVNVVVDGGEIGYNAFANCTSLENVHVKSGIIVMVLLDISILNMVIIGMILEHLIIS